MRNSITGDFRGKWYLSPDIKTPGAKLTLSTGATLSTGTTAAAGTARTGLESARFDGGNDGVISNRRAGDVGGARSKADGGLDVAPEVLDGLGDGADAGAARHSGDADGDAIRGGHG